MKNLKNVLLTSAVVSLALFSTTGFAQSKPQLTDPEIASVAVTANQVDVGYALIALKKSKDASILEFAKTMKNDHLSVIDMATKLVKKLGVTPKTNAVTKSLLDGSAKMKKSLHAKSGKAFDKAYIDNEVTYHQAVIEVVQNTLIPQAQNAELKSLLEKVLPTLKTNLEHAKMVQAALK